MSHSRLLELEHEHRDDCASGGPLRACRRSSSPCCSRRATGWSTDLLRIDPNLSLTLVFLVFTAVSYLIHGAFSFRGHGERDRQHVRATRFLVVNLLGFALNQFFVWLLVKQLGGPTWWPIIPYPLRDAAG